MRFLRLLFVPISLIVVVAGPALALPAAAAEETVGFSTGPVTFTPDGDGVDDTWESDVSTDSSSAHFLKVEVLDAMRSPVAVLYDRYGGPSTVHVSWDGTADGEPVPAGRYSVRAYALWGEATERTADVDVVVQAGDTVRLIAPAPGEALDLAADFRWQVRQGFDVDDLRFSLEGCGSWVAGPLADEDWGRAEVDLSACRTGVQRLSWTTAWRSEGGHRHRSVEETDVLTGSIRDRMIYLTNPREAQLTVDRPGHLAPLHWSLSCLDRGPVTITTQVVRNDTEVVRRLPTRTDIECAGRGVEVVRGEWDGRDDGRRLVSDGRYVVLITLTDLGPGFLSTTLVVTKDSRPPVVLRGVGPGDTVGPDRRLVWVPRDGVELVRVLVTSVGRGCRGGRAFEADNSGRVAVRASQLPTCQGAARALRWTATWSSGEWEQVYSAAILR